MISVDIQQRYVRRAFAAMLVGFLLLATGAAARSEDGCSSGRFPDLQSHKCVQVSSSNTLPLDDTAPMRFEALQISPVIYWLQATGTITQDTPAEFQKWLQGYDARFTKNIDFDSPGGNLMAALKLGELIRHAGMNTSVGRSIALEGIMDVYTYKKAVCASACAYAFLGGITRSYGDHDFYGIHRFGLPAGAMSGADAQLIGGILAKYVQSMGADVSLFQLASTESFKTGIFWVPVALAQQMRVIYDATGITSFVVEQQGGSVIARFRVSVRERSYSGVISCVRGRPTLALFDPNDTIPTQLRLAKLFPASFVTPNGRLNGTVTYVPAAPGKSAAFIAFELPGLSAPMFSGTGLSLLTIDNPRLSPIGRPSDYAAFAQRLQWDDAVTAFWFVIKAENATRTLPIVLRSCTG